MQIDTAMVETGTSPPCFMDKCCKKKEHGVLCHEEFGQIHEPPQK